MVSPPTFHLAPRSLFISEGNHMYIASRTFRKKKQQQTKYHSEMKCLFVQ